MNNQQQPNDERARMAANVGAFITIMIVLGLGYWLMNALARQSKLEDCLLAHRRDCAAVETPRS